jgi:hypothetical protein
MANQSGNAYALTILCPIRHGIPAQPKPGMEGQTHAACVRIQLQEVLGNENSPLARVPNTYLARFYLLNDVPYQGKPAIREGLNSDYLVFSSNFHGDLNTYLEGMWKAIEPEIQSILQHCFGFDNIRDSAGFIAYIRKVQVTTTFFFNGSTDEPLAMQLKSLYLKQEFSKFAFENQGKTPREIQAAFHAFVERVRIDDLRGPTWRPGCFKLETVVVDGGPA